MLDKLLPYYNQELTYIRKLAIEFSKKYPKIASHLHLGPGVIEDPHVSRLIESFAFLTSSIRHKLDDDFPEFTETLLNILYPHYLDPMPSFSIMQFKCQPELTAGYTIPKNTLLETTPEYSNFCQFTTAYPITLWPITVKQASLKGLPLNAPVNLDYSKAISTIRLTLTCDSEKMTFSKLAPDSLRFYLNISPQYIHLLRELILNNTIGLAIVSSASDVEPVFLNKSHIKAVGFDKDEGLLPYPTASLVGYRLLSEFFSFPEKFLFFDLVGLKEKIAANFGREITIIFYLDRFVKQLENNLSKMAFQLGCTPLVNLFQKTAEPIRLSHEQTEYRVIPDARRSKTLEVHSIKEVVALAEDSAIQYKPFYGIQHAVSTNHFWRGTRRLQSEAESTSHLSSDIYLSFTDLENNFIDKSDHIISVSTLCTNGNWPSLLPFGNNEPYLQLSSAKAPLVSMNCLMPFTSTQKLKNEKKLVWKLISHLSLNYLSLTDNEKGKDALKEILTLYNYKNNAELNNIINSITKVESRHIAARSPAGFQTALCQGIEITIKIDESQYAVNELYLFSQVLENFLASYASINSFTKLIITSVQKEGILYQWPPRAGNKVLL